MKRLALIAVFASIGLSGVALAESKVKSIDSNLPECESDEDKIKGCLLYGSDLNGKIRFELPFKNGKVNGIKREYFTDKTICEKKFVDDIIVSAEICFDKDGKPKNGVMKEYYNNGNLALEYEFQDGRIEGVAKIYYENGNLGGEIPYKNGKKEGVEKVYDANGKLFSETLFKDNKKVGEIKLYDFYY